MESTRNKLIQILANNDSTYISGQQLSKELAISRSAVWKHMKELEKDGYTIEGVSNKGYRIIAYPEKLSSNTIKWGLNTNWLGKTIYHKESIPSTQILAKQLASDDTEHGTVIIADEQTMGKGRLNRTWHSTNGKGIWMSLVLRPRLLPHLAPQLTLLTATVLCDVLAKVTPLNPAIKWPNDIFINHKKVAGILTEMQAEQDQIQYVVIGIGINVNHTEQDIPKDLKGKATSLRLESDRDWDIRDMIQNILLTFESAYQVYLDQGFPVVKEKWENYGYKLGESVWINTMKDRWYGSILGIAEDGALLAEKEGEQIKLYSAEIEW
ncbi:biotin--[acetyl-CoA-carboxylase] ligase [Oceanobacillus halotolerans]|uniref:biotin--[acetyl-CoA-carboxylase] ligase n=1 Tax=Oceanobacillus halotolerans TaxID=2663380 RepID=UPI0013D94080|nr:biotin--[acetyl-CoA-carboxylase] ligase [Oceanobacillus halotolerans]